MDGAVYEWNTQTGRRETECVLRDCRYTDVAITNCQTILAVGSDLTLKEIQDCQVSSSSVDVAILSVTVTVRLQNPLSVQYLCLSYRLCSPQVVREVSADETAHTTIAVSHSGKVIFTGTTSGTIRAIKYPLPIQKEWIKYQGHCGPITKVREEEEQTNTHSLHSDVF